MDCPPFLAPPFTTLHLRQVNLSVPDHPHCRSLMSPTLPVSGRMRQDNKWEDTLLMVAHHTNIRSYYLTTRWSWNICGKAWADILLKRRNESYFPLLLTLFCQMCWIMAKNVNETLTKTHRVVFIPLGGALMALCVQQNWTMHGKPRYCRKQT